MARKAPGAPDTEVSFGGMIWRRDEVTDFIKQWASRTDEASRKAYHDLNSQLTIDPDTGMVVSREIYDEAVKLWDPSVGSDFFEGTYAHAITPELLKKAKAAVTARTEQAKIDTTNREVLDSYFKLIKESPNANRGQTLLTSGRQGSNSILGSPIDPMKTVLT